MPVLPPGASTAGGQTLTHALEMALGIAVYLGLGVLLCRRLHWPSDRDNP